MVRSLAEHISSVGKLPLIEPFHLTGTAPHGDLASLERVMHLEATLTLETTTPLPRGPLLLVDDSYRSGWTMTYAAALLRDAGASAVLPLVIQQLP
jgi:ATP-dependent DNA helicase RecQ